MNKTLLTCIIAAAAALSAQAEAPAGYYKSVDGIDKPQTLKTTLQTIIKPHSTPIDAAGYATYYSNLPQYFKSTDVYPKGSDKEGQWWDMYSNRNYYLPSFSGMHREHSFPKSWWGGSTSIPPYVDLMHLYPADGDANMAKSNYPLGEVNESETPDFDNGVTKVGYPASGLGGGAKYVFEPADEYKGDFARTYFYMVTCYGDQTWKYTYMLVDGDYPSLKPWAISMLLEWSRKDPVSQKEVMRNEEVYRIQNNRNPFIDLPGIEEYIWGDKMYTTYHLDEEPPGTDPQLYSPVEGMALDFGQDAVGGTQTRHLLIHGANLTGDISYVVTGADKAQFSVEGRSVSSSLVNSATGYMLPVTYKPTSTGSHTASLTIYDISGWGGGSINVMLTGEAEEAPSLSKIKVLPASDITADSYVANWEIPSGDIVDYYVVNRTHYVEGKVITEELESDENALAIDGFDPEVYESYTVQSVRLGFRSPMSDAVVVAKGGIQGVADDQPLVVESYPEGLRIVCASEQTDLRVYDLTGRLVRQMAKVQRNATLVLPAGAYLVVTAEHKTPVKVLVR
ncbi:MAG: endonuclease [Muribaculaceae bacterium]|nr:endonuclease [Muribaculaceae bacterium]